ncbi:MAG TPA: DUF4097 family beta strand repeat-containing protein [Candidatus Limnocylindrales bacterium]|jgi:DUF4097 and DUF4098 domain-containing protein YvlB|nr:DUF4097 family beta strand repeat-containing protein [Candidatus Limnocylindrales bacterium]
MKKISVSLTNLSTATVLGVLTMASICAAAQAQSSSARKEAHLDLAAGGAVTIVNNFGSINLKSDSGHQVVIAYTAHSDKIEVDQQVTPDKRRVEIRAHAIGDQKPTADEARVDLDVMVPAGTSVTVNSSTAPITADAANGDLSLFSDTGHITVQNVARSHVQIQTVGGPVALNNVSGHVDVSTSGGAVQLSQVNGTKVKVGTGSGNITYKGDCSGGGTYAFRTHSGNIDMTLPQTASVDLTASSRSGQVENDFPLQTKTHPVFVPKGGRSFAGTSNSGSSSVELQSFSGRIRVKKQ